MRNEGVGVTAGGRLREDELSWFPQTEALKELPARRPVEPAESASTIQWLLVAPHRYEVTQCVTTVGFIDVVGAVYVVLSGARYSHAVEVYQTLVFDDAVRALAEAAHT